MILNKWSRGIVAVLVVTFLSSIGHAAVRHVPGDYTGIQKAIDASNNGDVILVSPGMYHENINFKGKAITLSSTNPADPNVVENTVIHAVGKSSVVTFATGETSNSILAGFTITGGYGTVNAAFGTDIYWGAGIYCNLSSPTIFGNIITANSAPKGDTNIFGYGSGIGCIQSDAIITRNLITANEGYAGSGILTFLGKARIASNLIYSNSAVIGGGAVLLSGSQFINNTLVGNAAEIAGNLYPFSDTSGQCLITDNIICNAPSGGGIYIDPQDDITQTAFNNVWNNTGGDYVGTNRTGVHGNISQDPLFVDGANNDYRLRDASPCINAGDPNVQPAAGDLDFYGNARLYATRVDIGAAEYFDNFRPIADAGPDQVTTVTALPALIALDGSASSDPNGAVLSYHWSQTGGPAGSFSDASAAKPAFNAFGLGTYTLELVVNNGSFNSFADSVQVTVKNDAPTADAGDDQMYSDLEPVASVTLNGSRSSDSENVALSYHWKQISGWKVPLSDPNAVNPTFMHPWPGIYLFQLVVNDGLQDSKPDVVAIVIGPNHAPIADAGLSRYVATGNVTLDGTRSYDPDGVGTLTYQWRQLSGPAVTMTGTNTAKPVVSVTPKTTVQKCVFELVVSDEGNLMSAPSNVTVTIVPNFGSNVLVLNNPPFDPARPTMVSFGGGNCNTGSGMTFGGVWDQQANWITVNTYGPAYAKYGDMLMVYLSSVAPDYKQPIQTIGFSTGNLPAMEVAWYANRTYQDARYAVNRVAMLDAVCSNLGSRVAQFHTNRIRGEQCWVDNYISNDPGFSRQPILPGAFNIICNPARNHSYPVQRYATSSLEYTNGGLTAFAYLSIIGDGKNYQLNTASQKYYFVINATESIVFFNQSLYPGKILAPVKLTGPADGATIDPGGAAFGCESVQNAVGYQLLFGSDPDRVMDYSIISDTPNPPSQIISNLPLEHTWWTVRAYDQFGSTIYADPRLIKLPENRPPVADAGPDQVIYAGLDGMAKVTVNGSTSTDPDGDALGFAWAWAIGANLYQSNGVSLTIELPIGVHTVQLMVNDGHVNSQPDEVNITVLPPNTPPMIVCHPLVAVDATGAEGAAVNVSVEVQDVEGNALEVVWTLDGAPVQTNNVPAGSPPQTNSVSLSMILSVGSHEIVASVSDHLADPVSCTSFVTVLGSLRINQAVLSELRSLRATLPCEGVDGDGDDAKSEGNDGTRKADCQRLDDAIKHLERSLPSDFWVDETHLTLRHGDKVFHEAREAVHKLVELMKDKKSSLSDALLQGFIDRIVGAARLLAEIAIRDGRALGQNPKAIEKAEKEFAKANDELADGKPENAIEHYLHAWRHARQGHFKNIQKLPKGAVELTITGIPGTAYTVETSTNLLEWVPLRTVVNTGDEFQLIDEAPPNSPQRFYRLIPLE